jgi:phosphate transport system substrate-binding protein
LKILTLLLCFLTSSNLLASSLTGVGSSLFTPVMLKWSEAFFKETHAKINYQPFGSGVGINQVVRRTVDFGASDKPLDDIFLKEKNLVQFPILAGGIVPVYHLPFLPKNVCLVLNGEVMAKIFQGKIKFWDDDKIKALNPSYLFPHKRIQIVARADGSGTTYNLTQYLVSHSSTFEKDIGIGTSVNWPKHFIKSKGNEGVAVMIQQIPYTIGYVELSYALENKMKVGYLLNDKDEKVIPTRDSLESAMFARYFSLSPRDPSMARQDERKAWPILATTYLLFQKDMILKEKFHVFLDFLKWVKEHGQAMAYDLDYILIPFVLEKLLTCLNQSDLNVKMTCVGSLSW